MKKYTIIAILFFAGSVFIRAQQPARRGALDSDDPAEQARIEWLRTHDPKIMRIPAHIRTDELKFAKQLPTREQIEAAQRSKENGGSVQSSNWQLRGPYNIGGRTRALGIDVADENVLLAAGVGGGMWRSSDKGSSWARVSTLDMMPGISTLAQDTRSGKTNTWYCGTGEFDGSTNYPVSVNPNYAYPGNGIYKSTDDGLTWFVLPATVSSDSIDIVQPFNSVFSLITDPADTSKDIVYAATMGGIERSTDGGTTWNVTLGSFTGDTVFSDIAVTKSGVLYAAIGSYSYFPSTYLPNGIYRSTDGINWTNVASAQWETNQPEIISIGISPSNEDHLYIFSYSWVNGHALWNYIYKSGDGSGSGGMWTNLTTNIPYDYDSQSGYDIYVRVKPDDENTVFIGGVNLYRSTDGFSTSQHISWLTDTSAFLIAENTIHVDEHALVFFPSNASAMLAGCDGGVYLTNDNLAGTVAWTPLHNGYYTTQFYRVAVDHKTPGSTTIIGGMQDNGTTYSMSISSTQPWGALPVGDGMTCAVEDYGGHFYFSSQDGFVLRTTVDGQGVADTTMAARIDPLDSGTFVWTDPYVLDPNDPQVMYYGGDTILWRNSDLSQLQDVPIQYLFLQNAPTANWTALMNTNIDPGNQTYFFDYISAIGISQTPANRVYYGTQSGKVFRLDNANSPNSTPVNITDNLLFPPYAFVNCIAVDPQNADNIIVVFSNYNVQSLFYSSNGGSSWKAIGGNLEQNADGSGTGPSCRWASILHVQNGIVYLVGTSTGLYATSVLNGMNTFWIQEGASTIGNNVVDMMDVRQSDGFVAVATHGAGVFSGNIASTVSGVGGIVTAPSVFALGQNYPDPFGASTVIQYTLPAESRVTLNVYDQLGREIRQIVSGVQTSGEHVATFEPPSDLPAGVYFYRLITDNYTATRQMLLVR